MRSSNAFKIWFLSDIYLFPLDKLLGVWMAAGWRSLYRAGSDKSQNLVLSLVDACLGSGVAFYVANKKRKYCRHATLASPNRRRGWPATAGGNCQARRHRRV